MTPAEHLFEHGYVTFPVDPHIQAWAGAALTATREALTDPETATKTLYCQGTWLAGMDVLPNATDGSVAGVPLAGAAVDAVAALGLTPAAWHRAQVSIVYPGYPKPREGESDTAANYRVRRDAAHVDGLLPVGPDRQRKLQEPHAFVLGVPLNAAPATASPLSVWAGSHRILGPALSDQLRQTPKAVWSDVDLTQTYQTARRACFEHCERITLPGAPGEAVLLHRHLLHGVAPWEAGALAEGRMIAYFRPEFPNIHDWAMTPE
jgi:hypothetical protein